MTPAFQLYTAIRLNDVSEALAILAAHPTVSSEWMLGQTYLHYAAANGDEELVSALLRLGADVDALTEDSQLTPLDTAAMYGNVRAFRLLCEAGAKVQHTTSEAGGTLIGALNSGSTEVVRLLGSVDG